MKKKMKILCSLGGKISDGPSAGNLLYIGGTTRVIRISDDTSWQQLREKTMAIYKQPHTIKYQLPGEDLDALVSVFCDEDLQLMMEFGDVGGSTGLEKLFSMFLFAGDSADPQAQQRDASRASAEGKLASGSSTSDYDPPPRSPPGKSELSRAASASADDRHALQVEIGKAEENLGAAASENEDRKHDVVVEATATAPAMMNEQQLLGGRKTCKSCQAEDVSVLLLPCRHLCLCKDCESRVETCPICNSTKTACLQIFFS